MNRKERRIAQSQDKHRLTLNIGGQVYGVEEANALAVGEFNRGNFQAAAEILLALTVKAPSFADAHGNLGVIMESLKRPGDALASYDKAVAINPGFADAYYNRGNLLRNMRRFEEAAASYQQAILCKPGHAEAYNNLGITLRELNRYSEALSAYDKAIAITPAYADAYNNRGLALHDMKRFSEALADYEKAIQLNPGRPEFYDNRGNTLEELYRHDEALADHDKAIALNPNYAHSYYHKGNALRDIRRYDEALDAYEKAAALKPDIPYLLGVLLNARMQVCHWQGIPELIKTIEKGIDEGKAVASPFVITATPLSLSHQRKCAEIYVQNKFPATAPLWKGEKYSHPKIRLGYFSSDLQNHATAYLMAELFELHDRAKFEITAFSFGPPSNDAMRKRLEKAFDRFIDVSAKSDVEIAAMARSMEIDIAVDLKGFTQNSRTNIFAMRPAPVQVNYLGYPGTMGAKYMDYIIADPTVILENHKPYYSEKIAYLPNSYQVNDSVRKISEKHFTRREMGLPENGFVFCCFNNSYKITPDVFDIWMRLLRAVPGSVLWLLEGNASASNNLRKEAEVRGIAGERLVFAKQMELADHLARHRLADLFLDTFYYNAHTTTSDALWARLPVLTYPGETFSARVAASLLSAANLAEMITHSHATYEALALELATNAQKLAAIREKLVNNRASCALFNTTLFTKHIEDAYVAMWKKSQAGLPPEDIYPFTNGAIA